MEGKVTTKGGLVIVALIVALGAILYFYFDSQGQTVAFDDFNNKLTTISEDISEGTAEELASQTSEIAQTLTDLAVESEGTIRSSLEQRQTELDNITTRIEDGEPPTSEEVDLVISDIQITLSSYYVNNSQSLDIETQQDEIVENLTEANNFLREGISTTSRELTEAQEAIPAQIDAIITELESQGDATTESSEESIEEVYETIEEFLLEINQQLVDEVEDDE